MFRESLILNVSSCTKLFFQHRSYFSNELVKRVFHFRIENFPHWQQYHKMMNCDCEFYKYSPSRCGIIELFRALSWLEVRVGFIIVDKLLYLVRPRKRDSVDWKNILESPSPSTMKANEIPSKLLFNSPS